MDINVTDSQEHASQEATLRSHYVDPSEAFFETSILLKEASIDKLSAALHDSLPAIIDDTPTLLNGSTLPRTFRVEWEIIESKDNFTFISPICKYRILITLSIKNDTIHISDLCINELFSNESLTAEVLSSISSNYSQLISRSIEKFKLRFTYSTDSGRWSLIKKNIDV